MATRNNKAHRNFIPMMNTAATVVLLVAVFITSTFSPSVHAASSGRIFGQLLDGTNKNAPVAGQSLTLQMAQGSTAKDLASVTTDAHGSYSFDNLNTDKSINYALYIRYQGAQYNSDIITLDTRPTQQVNLTVYQATSSTANIAIVRATVLLHTPAIPKGIITVSELFIFRNLDTHTYVGSLDASHGKPDALRFSLPHTARNVSLGKEFSGYNAVQVDRGIASDAAIPPGDFQFTFVFDIPYTASSYDFDYTVVYPTVQLSMLIPTDIHASSDILVSQGPKTADQHPYNLFQANTLLANKEVHLQLEGLPTATANSATSTTPFNLGIPFWLVVVLLIMVAILFVTLLFFRSTYRSSSKKKQFQHKFQHKQRQQDVPTKTKVHGSSDKEKALLQELLDLDKSYEAGKLTRIVYQERRAKTKARLRSLMSEKVTP
ncbi:MAG: hypothetical protein NVSMB33_09420 [Ktedonobacteraceae bacterium]